MSEKPDLSPVDIIKLESDYLRGNLAAEFADETDHVSKDSTQLIKHFGTYQQDDRDARKQARETGKGGKSFIYMVRTKIPGGKLTSKQLLAEFDCCDQMGGATLRITSRQGLQIHGVLKHNLQRLIGRINELGLSTLGACGDVNRNVMCCPAPLGDPVHREMQALAERLASRFAPRTHAYHELFLQNTETGEREQLLGKEDFNGPGGDEVEPLYGRQYLPRKFKIGVGLPEDNCIDIYTHDLGLMAVHENGQIIGYNVLVGGGQGTSPSVAKTFPALAHRMTFATVDQVIDVATAVVQVQRDFGNRTDRKVARLKYLIHDWGLDKFKAKVEEYFGAPLPDPHPADVTGFDDHMGWHDQGDGRWFYGLNIENGRIKDEDGVHCKSALREICETLQPGIRLTSHQSMLLTDLLPEQRETLEAILRRHNVRLSEDFSTVRRWSMACVAWPTCGLSITESERALPGILDQMEVELAKLGLDAEKFTVRMTGCPNGCARPYNCDIGLVGRAKDKYTIFVGGRLLGDRLNFLFKDHVLEGDVAPTLTPVFAYFKQDREPGESFGDFCHRKGTEDLLAWSEQFLSQTAS